jgi:hypothetical protein
MNNNKERSPVRDPIIDSKQFFFLPEEEKKGYKKQSEKYEKIPLWSKIALGFAAVSIILYVIVCLNKGFADLFNEYIGGAFRFVLAQITNILPFSLAEAALLLIPVLLFLVIRYVWIYRCNTRKATIVTPICILSIASMFFSGFVMTFAAGYRGTELEDKLGIQTEAIDKYDLYNTAEYLIEEINKLSPSVDYDSEGFSIMPYSFDEMNDKLIEAYDKFSGEHSFINNFYSKLKPVLLSEAMSYAHITGIYTFFTGESNLNVDFPDYTIPYTAAHELAHQRGIAREDEANMMAFLVSLCSDDVYIRYCAYVNMYEYVANALYRADKDLFKSIDKTLDAKVIDEQIAYSKFFKKYSQSITSQVSGTVNDIYLQAQGTEGKKSYGMVVDLTVAYLESHGEIEE